MKRHKFIGIRRRMMMIFAVLISITGIGIAGIFVVVFRYGYGSISQQYLEDVNRQTTNNLEHNIQKTEDINLQILSSQTMQNQLKAVNSVPDDFNSIQKSRQIAEREVLVNALYEPYMVSISVISVSGIEFSVKKVGIEADQFGFTEEEIYAANGSSLWKVIEGDNRICVAKAILDLTTMKPLGYINIIYENDYLSDIVKDNSINYEGAAYVVDGDGKIVAGNKEEYLGTEFPVNIEELKNLNNSQYDFLSSSESFYYIGNKMQNDWTLVQTVSVKEFYRELNRMVFLAAIAVLFILGISFVFVRMATSKIAKPTQELLESMKKLGKEGKYPRVKEISYDEIGLIGKEYNEMAAHIEMLIEKVYKMELTHKQAELEFLQMQINPHFLYNTLDTISWLAMEKGNTEISDIAIALAELLRATIKKEHFVTLNEELKAVKDYLLIQKERFGDKITVCYDVAEEVYDCQVPNFILQPLVENAIIHGLEPKIEKGKLMIQIHLEERKLHFLIADNGIGMTEEEIEFFFQQCEEQGTKQFIGLKNVYRRLILCYGEESRLHIISRKNEGTKIQFLIPLDNKVTGKKVKKT